MPDVSLATIPLFGDAEFYLPLKVADHFHFKLSYHLIDGKFWGSIQDWLVGLVGNPATVQKTWTKFLTSDAWIQLSTSGRQLTADLDYIASDGKTYQTAHGCEALLYHLALYVRSTKSRPQVAAVKAYLAESGVIVGEMVRDPEGTAIKLLALPDNPITRKEIRAVHQALDSGYSYDEGRQHLAAREGLTEANKRAREERGATGLLNTPSHWASLGLEDFRVAVGMTQEQWREANGAVKDISDHLSTLDLVALTYLKEAIADKIAVHRPTTYTELYDMISNIGTEVERVRRVYSRTLPKVALKDQPKPKQLKASAE